LTPIEIGPLRLPSEAHATAYADMVSVIAGAGIELTPDDMLLHAMTRYTQQAHALTGKTPD
jgi:hypothetical protein